MERVHVCLLFLMTRRGVSYFHPSVFCINPLISFVFFSLSSTFLLQPLLLPFINPSSFLPLFPVTSLFSSACRSYLFFHTSLYFCFLLRRPLYPPFLVPSYLLYLPHHHFFFFSLRLLLSICFSSPVFSSFYFMLRIFQLLFSLLHFLHLVLYILSFISSSSSASFILYFRLLLSLFIFFYYASGSGTFVKYVIRCEYLTDTRSFLSIKGLHVPLTEWPNATTAAVIVPFHRLKYE